MTLKEKIIDLINTSTKALYRDEIAEYFNLFGQDAKDLYKVLSSMEKEGLIYRNRKEKYTKVDGENIIIGKVDMTERGFAFVEVEGRDDIFVPEDDINTAMDGDTVVVSIKHEGENGKRAEGEIQRVINRAIKIVVGVFYQDKNFGFVVPDNKKIHQDIFIKKDHFSTAKNGQKVVVSITKYGEKQKNPEGKIIEVLGYPNEKGVDVLSVAIEREIRMEFPDAVLEEAASIPQEVTESDLEDREDFRDELIFTIDGPDAKDLDDAISIEKLSDELYRLGVHIADVTNYVKENSPLDKEALLRGTSVYLIDRVIPMLPKELSNGICSLNPDVDRLTLSVIMDINKSGKVVNSKITNGVIRSKRRLIYETVSDLLEHDSEEAKVELGELVEPIRQMHELMQILHHKRELNGAIDFDFEESKIELDENGKVVDIYKDERRVGNRLIEEFMLITNETVSETYFWQEIPFLYRVHETPDPEKLANFLKFIHGFGYSVKGNQQEIHPRELQSVISQIKGKKEEAAISKMMLRSLKKARYSEINDIHFGLSSKYYSHFTSPIRRYPDLQIHRIIKENLAGTYDEKRLNHYESLLPVVAESTSKTERAAEEAERDVDSMKKAEYMERFIDQEFDGIISGITSFGIFVELENTVEGLVHYNAIEGDYYVFDEYKLTAVGEKTGKEYSLGMPVRIKVHAVDVQKRAIDFKFVDKVQEDEDEEG